MPKKSSISWFPRSPWELPFLTLCVNNLTEIQGEYLEDADGDGVISISADYDAMSSMSDKPVYYVAVNPDPAKFDVTVGHGLEIYAGEPMVTVYVRL